MLTGEVQQWYDALRRSMQAGETSVGIVLGGGAMRHKVTGQMVYHLGELDLDAPEGGAQSIDLGFLAHGITPSPHDPALLVMFEKHGPGCCVVDLRARSVVRTIEAPGGREFYGHGAFSRDGSLLYCTETDVRDRNKGYIAVRDGRDFAYLGDFPSFGQSPHDCMLAADGRTLVVSNGGSPVHHPDGPNVAYVDVDDRKLVELCEVPEPSINAGHLALSADGDLALVSAPRDGLPPEKHRGGISLRRKGGALETLTEPRDVTALMLGETLSVAIHEGTGIVGATNPLGHVVTFWRLDTGELVKKLRVPSPRGIAISLAGDDFVLNFGDPPRAARVRADTLEPVDAPGNRRGHLSLATGSHILMYPRV
jgi:hypothetical protein